MTLWISVAVLQNTKDRTLQFKLYLIIFPISGARKKLHRYPAYYHKLTVQSYEAEADVVATIYRNVRSRNHGFYKRHTLQPKQLKNLSLCKSFPLTIFSSLHFSSVFIMKAGPSIIIAILLYCKIWLRHRPPLLRSKINEKENDV